MKLLLILIIASLAISLPVQALEFFDGRYLYDPVGREIGLPIRPLHLRQQRKGHDLWYTTFC